MAIGKQPFGLPINTVKKETSIQELIRVQNWSDDPDPDIEKGWTYPVSRKIHTQGVKVKFFITGFRKMLDNVIEYVGKWVELETGQADYVQNKYILAFNPYEYGNDLVLRLNLTTAPDPLVRSEIYIEKLTVMDSDFDSSLSWISDTTLPVPLFPPIPNPVDPVPPPVDEAKLDSNWVW